MAGQVYAVASGKGGVGKTTTVVNLGVALRVEGNEVALVDADLGMANVAALLDVAHEPTLHDVLAGTASVEDALTEKADGFGVVPGARSLAAFADADPSGLDDVIEYVAERYDYVLVDTGAGLGYDEVLPLGLVDGVLLVTTPEPAAVGDTRKTAEMAGMVDRPVRGVVVTRADEGTDAPGIAAELDAPLLGTIPEDPTVRESSEAGEPIRGVDLEAPAALAYADVAAVLTGEREVDPDAAAGATADRPAGADGPDRDAVTGEPSDGAAATADAEPSATDGGAQAATASAASDGDDTDDEDVPAEDGAIPAADETIDTEETGDADETPDAEESGGAESTDDPDDSESGDGSEDETEADSSGGMFGWLGRLFG